ncbi:MAG: EamA family transporter [Elusimicrobiota bacterium]
MKISAFVFALTVAVFWGVAPIFGKMGLVNAQPGVALALRSFVVTVILFIWVGLTGKFSSMFSLTTSRSGLAIAAEGILASLLGHLAYYYALKSGSASKVVPITSAFPLVAMAVGILFLNEKLTFTSGLGGILIISGIILIKI